MAEFLGRNVSSGDTITDMVDIKRRTVEKWQSLGILDHLSDNPPKENIARLLEGEASHLVNENNTQESSGFDKVIFPRIRSVYARAISSDITPDFWKKIDFLPVNKIKKHKL